MTLSSFHVLDIRALCARDSIPARSAAKLTATSDKKARASAPPVAVSLEQRRHGDAPPIRARNLGQPRGKRRHARRARFRARARAPRPRRGRKGGGRGTAAHKTTQSTAPARGAWRAPCRQRRGRGSVWAAAAAALRARASAGRNRAASRPVHGDALRPPTLDTDRGGRHASGGAARLPRAGRENPPHLRRILPGLLCLWRVRPIKAADWLTASAGGTVRQSRRARCIYVPPPHAGA